MPTDSQINQIIEEAYSIHQAAFVSISIWYHRVEALALRGFCKETEEGCKTMAMRLCAAHQDSRAFLESRGLGEYFFLVEQDMNDEKEKICVIIDYLLGSALAVACTRTFKAEA
jgi:hypothetical protein